MRAIRKGPEPASLTLHRQTSHSDYDNYAEKDVLRAALVSEQRGLCCYCLGRIAADPTMMKIEHWRCQDEHPDEQLNWKNLLGACKGAEGSPEEQQHCDTKKGKRDILWSPADPMHNVELQIRYEIDGSIRSNNAVFDGQLESVLNLNLGWLKSNRKEILDAIIEWWKWEKDRLQGPVPRARLERQRSKVVDTPGELKPYCQVTIWWLDQRLLKMA